MHYTHLQKQTNTNKSIYCIFCIITWTISSRPVQKCIDVHVITPKPSILVTGEWCMDCHFHNGHASNSSLGSFKYRHLNCTACSVVSCSLLPALPIIVGQSFFCTGCALYYDCEDPGYIVYNNFFVDSVWYVILLCCQWDYTHLLYELNECICMHYYITNGWIQTLK